MVGTETPEEQRPQPPPPGPHAARPGCERGWGQGVQGKRHRVATGSLEAQMDPKGVLHLNGASQMEMTQGLTGHLTDL